MQTLISCSSNSPVDAWERFSETFIRESFLGNLEFDSPRVPDATFGKSLGFPISVTRLAAGASLGYRRSWAQIRNNSVGLKTIWYVQRGSMTVVRTQGSTSAGAGEAVILDSNAPFQLRILCDEHQVHQSLQIVVPPDLFATHLAETRVCNRAFHEDAPSGPVARSLLELLAEKGELLSRRTARGLAETLLDSIGENVKAGGEKVSLRQRLADRRLADIREFIELNVTDPDLSYAKVAKSCGISPRYLCYVLKANGKSYTDLVWGTRLPKARDMLLSARTRNYSIREVAFMSGFKSAAHFTRKFKAMYGVTPREYRDNGASGSLGGSTPITGYGVPAGAWHLTAPSGPLEECR